MSPSTTSLYRVEELEALLDADSTRATDGAVAAPPPDPSGPAAPAAGGERLDTRPQPAVAADDETCVAEAPEWVPAVEEDAADAARRHTGIGGLAIAVLSAVAFATSGSFAKALLESGWSSGAAVTVRIVGAALALTVPAVLSLRGRWHALPDNGGTVLGYGIVAIAGSQLFYFNAVDHLSVGVALLLEYFSPVLLIGFVWATTRRRPPESTLLGGGLATAGLALVIDLFGGISVDATGLFWGLAAACCAVAYYVLGARPTHGLPPIALAWAGMVVGALVLGTAGALDIMPVRLSTADVSLAGHPAPFWVPVLGLAVIAGAVSYASGIAAARRLGSTVASFVGLTEILFAIAIAFLLLGEVPTWAQLAGAVLILTGVATVKFGETRA